jgi:hypothetical protein
MGPRFMILSLRCKCAVRRAKGLDEKEAHTRGDIQPDEHVLGQYEIVPVAMLSL